LEASYGETSQARDKDAMTVATIGSYRVLDKLGEGGMGEVYRATDAALGRQVAVKILPEAFAADPERLARFEREAKTLASLNHPHIAAIYGFERSGGVHALVMELVEGEDLSQRVSRGALPIDEALPIARQIAQALESAHEQGIIHRDLKPANIKIRADGAVKVLDFGLAKAMDTDASRSTADAMNSPTLSLHATQAGIILGTAAYMAPEQARGKAVDRRADIWAFGCVLFEMLTGARAFAGDDTTDVLAAVVRAEPDWSLLPAALSPSLRVFLRRCLDKDPKQRIGDIRDVRLALDGAFDSLTTPGPALMASKRSWLGDPRSIATLGLAVASLGIAWFVWSRPRDSDADTFPYRLEIASTADARFGASTLSPDGRAIVLVRATPGSPPMLYLRRLDQTTARPIAGTEGGTDPVFSPDGKSIAYIANRRTLTKTALDGTPIPLADIGDMGGGLDWSTGDQLVAGSGVMQGGRGLLQSSAAGGALRELTRVDASNNELSHQWPKVLGDGKTVLFTIWHGTSRQAELAVTSLDDGRVTRLGIQAVGALGVVDGRLVYAQSDGTLMAVPFDVTTRRVSGTAVPVQDRVSSGGGNTIGRTSAFLTRGGGLAFQTGEARRRLVWADRKGAITPALNLDRAFDFLRLSPDGRQVAVIINTANQNDVWVLDLTAATLMRLTNTGETRSVAWSADSRRVLFTSTHGGRGEFWWQLADGSSSPEKAGTPPHNPWWTDVSPDRQSVVYNAVYDGSWNLQALKLGQREDARPVATAPIVSETMGRFSPDGAAVAYVSNESGREEVYIRPFAPGGGRVQVSINGGRRPIWSADGRELFFWESGQMMSATLVRDPSLRVTSRQALFGGNTFDWDYDVAKDGRFLLIQNQYPGPAVVVVPNWRTELARLTGARRAR
jgi:serine/threonine protein kinase/Tol biopolymer transport system component